MIQMSLKDWIVYGWCKFWSWKPFRMIRYTIHPPQMLSKYHELVRGEEQVGGRICDIFFPHKQIPIRYCTYQLDDREVEWELIRDWVVQFPVKEKEEHE